MANVNVAATQLLRAAGVAPAQTTLSATDVYFVENAAGTTFLYFEGDATNARNVTIVTPVYVDGRLVDVIVIPIPAASKKMWGMATPGTYNDPVSGRFQVTVDGAGVKMSVLKV